jgi:hypothetical protein
MSTSSTPVAGGTSAAGHASPASARPASAWGLTDARVLELARKHLDTRHDPDRYAHITRSTGAELLAFARALLAEHEGRRIAELIAVRDALEGVV